MAHDEPTPVSHWLADLKAGDPAAAGPLWELYFDRLVRLVRARFPPGGDADGEDVALSAFDSFCRGAACGRFPDLHDRHDLWRLLLFITAQKIADHLHRRNARKRGGGAPHADPAALEQVIGREPTPELAAAMADEVRRFLDRLGDNTLRQIALWKMEGCTNQEIADRLGRALRTVNNKLDLIRKTLQAAEAP